MAPPPACVTGAAGFIGSHLVDALLSTGHRVLGIDRRHPRDDPSAAANLAGALGHPLFTLLPLDFAADAPAVETELAAALHGCDTVYHLGAIPGVRDSWDTRFDRYVAVNVIGTARLLRACRATGVRRLVYASSSSVYGSVARASRETDATWPASPYGVTKLAGEQLCLAFAGRTDTELTVSSLRYFTVYGPRQRPDMAIARTLLAALDRVPLELFGDGGQRREFTFVADVVAATMAAGRAGSPPPVVNVGGGASVTMTDVLRVAAEMTGEPVPVVPGPHRPGDVAVTAADLTVAERALGYRPRVGLAEGMKRQLDWMRSLGPELRRALLAPHHPIKEVAVR